MKRIKRIACVLAILLALGAAAIACAYRVLDKPVSCPSCGRAYPKLWFPEDELTLIWMRQEYAELQHAAPPGRARNVAAKATGAKPSGQDEFDPSEGVSYLVQPRLLFLGKRIKDIEEKLGPQGGMCRRCAAAQLQMRLPEIPE